MTGERVGKQLFRSTQPEQWGLKMEPDLKDFISVALDQARLQEALQKQRSEVEAVKTTVGLAFCFQGTPPKTIEECPAHIDKLRDMFRYDAATGKLHYAFQPGPITLVTTPGRNGHGRVSFYTMTSASGRMVWLLHHGRWPNGKLGRRDKDVTNDRIENLYEPRAERNAAAPIAAAGATPAKRVRKNPSRGVSRCGPDHWQAYARVAGRQKGLGRFTTEDEALAARAAWDRGEDLV